MNKEREIWLPIIYGEFYDIPRAFIVNFKNRSYFFDCSFNDAIDEYPDEFTIFELCQEISFDSNAISWKVLQTHGKRIGSIRVQDVIFDESKRKTVRVDVIGLIQNQNEQNS